MLLLRAFVKFFSKIGDAIFFLKDIIKSLFRQKIRYMEVFNQVYEQGLESVLIVILTSLSAGIVLALQGHVMMNRFGAKEFVAQLVALSLIRELSPVFTALIFSGKAGARITAELGTMNVNDQVLATRTLGVDPIGFLVTPRFLACLLVLPVLTIISEVMGILGGYMVGVFDANIPSTFYLNQTFKAIRFIDFGGGFVKTIFFSWLVAWICCYQGFFTRGGSLGVGKFTTKAVALSYIVIIISDMGLTKIILTLWG